QLTLHSFLFNPTPHSYILTLSLHDALPIFNKRRQRRQLQPRRQATTRLGPLNDFLRVGSRHPLDVLVGTGHAQAIGIRLVLAVRSEEHTSELQSLAYLVCRLLLEKKKKNNK